ncbi:MAG: hypothetical protein IPM07_12705 [Anaerolineales bacterium]|nr:hypothetical protein [Anaerolineales bacterium]
MKIFDENGKILLTPASIAYIHQLLLAEPAITGIANMTRPEIQEWGSTALHFAATAIETGESLLVKVNVPQDQLWWTRELTKNCPELLPHVYATGTQLAGIPLGWTVWERVFSGLNPGWQGREFEMLLEADVKFQQAAKCLEQSAREAGVLHELNIEEVSRDLERGMSRRPPGPAARVIERLGQDWHWVTTVCEFEVCHGDLHMANALCRSIPPDGEALLIDYHPVRMPWAIEPAKPEILNADPSRVGCRDLIIKQGHIRTKHGMSSPKADDLKRLQTIVLGWSAIHMWGYIGSNPDPLWRTHTIWRDENEAYIAAAAQA